MSDFPREISQLEPTRGRSLRREVVDVLEHCYGPLFLSIGFGVFLTLDAAREVMVIYAAEIVDLFRNFGRYAFGVVILAVIAAGVFFAGLVTSIWMQHRTAWSVLTGFMMAFMIILIMSYETTLRNFGLGFLFDGEGRVAQHIDYLTAQYQDMMTVPARILLGALAFFYVPVALYWATGYALKAEMEDLSGDFAKVRQLPPSSFAHWVLTLAGRIPLLLGGGALIHEGIWGLEAIGAERPVLVVLGVLCVGAASIRLFFKDLNERAMGPAVNSAPFGLSFVATFVVLSFLLYNPVMTVVAGPIAISSMFVIVAAVILAGLTFLSKRASKGHFPLILIPVAFAIAAAGPGGAIAMTITTAILLWALVIGRDVGGWWKRLGIAFVAIFAAMWVGQSWYGLCKTMSGCNIIQGVEVAEGDVTDAHDSVRDAFLAWKGTETPKTRVTLVAAQGGGLFAGYHAAYDLAYRQDLSVKALANGDGTGPTFADTLFAISGVSGGSFGAAAFWAVRESGVCERWQRDPALIEFDAEQFEGCYTFLIHEILNRDYLSLSLSGLLFADNIDGFLPRSAFVAEPVDRAHRFTEQFIEAVDEVLARYGYESDSRLLDTGLRASWTPGANVPLLFLNTTDLYSGERVVQSPIDRFVPPGGEGYQATSFDNSARTTIFANDGTPRDLTVANAAVLSARFPIVSPPGRYRACVDAACDPPKLKQIADGGYFDNTGLETIADILTAIGTELHGMEVEVISFSIIEKSPEDKEEGRRTKGTLRAPIGGMVAATTARRDLTVARFCERWHQNIAKDTRAQLDLRRFQDGDGAEDVSQATHNFTLSWVLSTATFRQIATKIAESHAKGERFCT